MPIVRKLTIDEVKALENPNKGQRKQIEAEYDSILNEYAIGDYGIAELGQEEKRLTIRNRLKAAAERRDLTLEFRRTKGPQLRFRVLEASTKASSSSEGTVTAVAVPAPVASVDMVEAATTAAKPGRKPRNAPQPVPAPVVAPVAQDAPAPKRPGRPKKNPA
jgi:hypothetical protein